ncbi:MAG TPA: UxaA family hydrolase, partial [Opitutaceae bacterium]|nr:UxaA family hydrolase [Opitutaceae bacterium]
VSDYAEPLRDPGFYFMNGPGNDLEGVAGQIAAGCNLVLFVTGNGSITNFPFVPTLKITTTTRRHQLLVHEMDINAGRYLDGEPMAALVEEGFETAIATASGRRTKGEHAGHSQVSLWRNWRQTDASHVAELKARPDPDGHPLKVELAGRNGAGHPVFEVFRLTGADGSISHGTERVGLVLPTSLCSAQIARLAADRLNEKHVGHAEGISRFVALAHTEGCGFGGESMYHLLHRTYRGYLTHPNVTTALLLEHGCEKVPNDVMRRQLENAGIPLTRFGWASVQLDGGIAKALDRIEAWFAATVGTLPPAALTAAGPGALSLAFVTEAPVGQATATVLARAAAAIVADGGTVLVPEGDELLANTAFRLPLLGRTPPHATLLYGQPVVHPGLHVVATESSHLVENVTGLAASGAHAVVAVVRDHPGQGHPLVPVIQVAEAPARGRLPSDDVDLFFEGDPAADESALWRLVKPVVEGDAVPVATAHGMVDFQLTRGLLGVTT